MKNLFKTFTALLLTVLLIIPQIAFAADGGKWLNIKDYDSRKNYPIDRGEICKYIVDLYTHLGNKKTENIVNVFSDVNEKKQPWILEAYQFGIIKGTGPNTFSPQKTITKADLSVMLLNVVNKTYPDKNFNDSKNINFNESIPSYAENALKFTYTRGICEKSSHGHIGGNDKLTLGEAIDMINKTFKYAPGFEIAVNTFSIKNAYLTFDDGTSKNSIPILDILKKYNVNATFFVTGKVDSTFLKRAKEDGNVIGNHTMSHDYKFIYSSPQIFWEDFFEEEKYLESHLGYKPTFLRFPGGSNNTVSIKSGGKNIMNVLTSQAKQKGYIYFDWNVDSGDATEKTLSKDKIVSNVLNGAKDKNEAVILMHQTANKTTTVDALPEIIDGLKKMGFSIIPLNKTSYKSQFLK